MAQVVSIHIELYLDNISTRMDTTWAIIPMSFKNYKSNQMQILCGEIEVNFVNTLPELKNMIRNSSFGLC